jgi:site-specific DNA recombinase
MTRVAVYARTSRQEGEAEGSIPVQLADCRARARDAGWEIVAEYTDPGISGWKRKRRPGYEAMFADAAAGRIDAVLARDYERLLRNDKEGARWLELYEERGFRHFRFADEADIDLGRARDRKDFKERTAAAVYYSDRLGEKLRRTKRESIAAGKYTGGEKEPFGYRRVNGAFQVDPEEAGVIHDAVARLAQGEALARITTDLNNAGRTTSRGARWRPKTMRRLLQSQHLTGERGYARILSDEEAAVVRSVFAQEQRSVGAPAGRRHPLSGVLRCGECGAVMTGNTNQYRCTSAAGGCGAVSIRALPLERWLLLESLRHWWENRDADAGKAAVSEQDPGALAELREIEQSLDETRALVGEGKMRPADAAPILTQLAARQADAAERLSRTLQTAPKPPVKRLAQVFTRDELRSVGLGHLAGGSAEEFRLRWEAREPAAVAAVRDLVKSQVEHAVISRRVQRGREFDPSRVNVEWA